MNVDSSPIDYVRCTLAKLGYSCTEQRHKNANGVDVFAIKKDMTTVLSVEVKSVDRKDSKGVYRIRGVSKPRQNDDLIAIVFPTGYVLIEPMRDHLKCCNKQGYRFINI